MSEQFDDPQLKGALKRVWGGETAPAALRERIERMLAEEAPALAGRGWPKAWAGYAMAAAILLTASLVTWLPWGGDRFAEADEQLPRDVTASMVRTHDRCCGAKDHHLVRGVGENDFAGIGMKLSNDLKIPVISTPVAHWKFEGAGPCPVWGHESAHLLYRRGPETLSIFSIPASDFSMAGRDEDYEAAKGTHVLAGFIRGHGLYCVVENSPDGGVTPSEARRLRDELRRSFEATTVAAGEGATLALVASSERSVNGGK